jgi:hypothetical protein
VPTDLSITPVMSNCVKVHSMVLELLHGDRQADRHGEANKHIFAVFHCICAKNELCICFIFFVFKCISFSISYQVSVTDYNSTIVFSSSFSSHFHDRIWLHPNCTDRFLLWWPQDFLQVQRGHHFPFNFTLFYISGSFHCGKLNKKVNIGTASWHRNNTYCRIFQSWYHLITTTIYTT